MMLDTGGAKAQLLWRKEAYVNFHEELGFEFGFASNVGQMKEEDHIPNLGNGVSLDTEAEITLAYSEWTTWPEWRVLICGLRKKWLQ